MQLSTSWISQNRYEIKVHGQLNDSWLGWFGAAKVCVETLADNNQVTTFSDVGMDQAGFVGEDSSSRPYLHFRAVQVSGSQAYREAWFRVFPAPEHCPARAVAFFPKAQRKNHTAIETTTKNVFIIAICRRQF